MLFVRNYLASIISLMTFAGKEQSSEEMESKCEDAVGARAEGGIRLAIMD